jgi:uncharacterized protein (AIM24 family)
MPIEFHCYVCGQRLRVADEHAGQRARCPQCEAVLDIPRTVHVDSPIVLTEARPAADVIDYLILGTESQYVEVILDPGEVAIAEAGSLLYLHGGIEMEMLGDPALGQPSSGIWRRLTSPGRQILSAESLNFTAFYNAAHKRQTVAFAPPWSAKLLPIHLDQFERELLCLKDSFLCAARGIEISIAHQKHNVARALGRHGFALLRLVGDGIAILLAGGMLIHRKLADGETIHLEATSVVAMTAGIQFQFCDKPGVKNAFLDGRDLMLAAVTGPGNVWLQSLPMTRLAGRVLA